MSGFMEKLRAAWERNDSLLCVGLDPEIERFPRHILAEASPIFHFNRSIIDATADLVCAFKPQFAHYAAYEAISSSAPSSTSTAATRRCR
jgi:orotidine-5'-phosphate decarboxylase